MKNISRIIIAVFLSIATSQLGFANAFTKKADLIYPAAIFDFVEKDKHLSGLGKKISTIIYSGLVVDPAISLVDREEIDKLVDESVLNLSGMVNANHANQIGQLTGAKIIVTGSVFEVEDSLMIVSKIIGTETSRVMGASAKGKSITSIVTLAEDLAKKIANIISKDAKSLVAKPVHRSDRIAALKQQLIAAEKPSVTIDIKEHHINRSTVDPAAEIEMMFFSKESGFEVINKGTAKSSNAKLLISGEGFTEFATRKGDLVGVKARLEVKVIDQETQQVLAVDRQTALEVDLSEIIASKKALQKASAQIAERILPKIVGS